MSYRIRIAITFATQSASGYYGKRWGAVAVEDAITYSSMQAARVAQRRLSKNLLGAHSIAEIETIP